MTCVVFLLGCWLLYLGRCVRRVFFVGGRVSAAYCMNARLVGAAAGPNRIYHDQLERLRWYVESDTTTTFVKFTGSMEAGSAADPACARACRTHPVWRASCFCRCIVFGLLCSVCVLCWRS